MTGDGGLIRLGRRKGAAGAGALRRALRPAGGMAEWLKASVLKTEDRKVRGFESLSLRPPWFAILFPEPAPGGVA
jgi:hypothetical protein